MTDAQALTLVLDIGWQPLNRVPVAKAVRLLLKGRAEVIEEHDRVLWTPAQARPEVRQRTATEEFRSPSVVRLLHVVANRSKSVKFSRMNIWLRDKGRCAYCGDKVPLDGEGKFTYDHVTPASQGGTRRWENIVTCCYECNQRKAGRTPVQAGMRLLVQPVRPKSLPGAAGRGMQWSKGMPESWKQYVRDTLYWNDSLDES